MTATNTTPWRSRRGSPRPPTRDRALDPEADTGPRRRHPRCDLGEWLVQRGLITRVDLFEALDASYRHGCRLGDALIWLTLIDRGRLEDELVRRDGATPRRQRERPRPPRRPTPDPDASHEVTRPRRRSARAPDSGG